MGKGSRTRRAQVRPAAGLLLPTLKMGSTTDLDRDSLLRCVQALVLSTLHTLHGLHTLRTHQQEVGSLACRRRGISKSLALADLTKLRTHSLVVQEAHLAARKASEPDRPAVGLEHGTLSCWPELW